MRVWAKIDIKAGEKLANLYEVGDAVELETGENASVINIDEAEGFVELDMEDTGTPSGVEQMTYRLPDEEVPIKKV